MRHKKNRISRARRILTWILFVIFVVLPILWFYSVRNDYYIKVEQREKSLVIQPKLADDLD